MKTADTELHFLPKQILNADISKSNTPNIISRIVTAPLTWSGQMLGIVGRTTGGMISSLGNGLENIASGTGIALGETFQGQFGGAARSVGDMVVETVVVDKDFDLFDYLFPLFYSYLNKLFFK